MYASYAFKSTRCIHLSAYIYICMYIGVYTQFIHSICLYTCIYICIFHLHTCKHVQCGFNVCMYIYVYRHMYTCLCLHIVPCECYYVFPFLLRWARSILPWRLPNSKSEDFPQMENQSPTFTFTFPVKSTCWRSQDMRQ